MVDIEQKKTMHDQFRKTIQESSAVKPSAKTPLKNTVASKPKLELLDQPQVDVLASSVKTRTEIKSKSAQKRP